MAAVIAMAEGLSGGCTHTMPAASAPDQCPIESVVLRLAWCALDHPPGPRPRQPSPPRDLTFILPTVCVSVSYLPCNDITCLPPQQGLMLYVNSEEQV